MRIASCVSASTPSVTRTSARSTPAAAARPASSLRVEHDRCTDRRRLRQEGLVLVVAVDDEVAAAEARGTRERELAGGGDVRADPRLVQQAEQGDVGERLRPEEDPPVADGRPERVRPLAQRLLAEDDERRPVRLGELRHGDPAERQLAVVEGRRFREER